VSIGAISEPPARSNWSSPLAALKHALGLERTVNQVRTSDKICIVWKLLSKHTYCTARSKMHF
jgi:hypothetical protein